MNSKGRIGAAGGCVAILVVALAAAVPVQAAGEVPFKGSATATYVMTDYVNLVSLFSLSGKATQIGKLTGWTKVQYDPATYFPVSTQSVLAAANGDLVYMSTVDEFEPVTKTSTGTFTITGGTGRFENATGTGSFSASGSGAVVFEWDGTISW
jgi:hypothetical protein